MTTRKLLSVTSHKKKDTMAQWTNTLNDGTSTVVGMQQGAAYVRARPPVGTLGVPFGGFFWWDATARASLTNDTGGKPNIFDESTRTSTTCFMRGLRERIDIETSNAKPWRWRRVCITTHDSLFDSPSDPAFVIPYNGSLLTSNGYGRPWYNAYTLAGDTGVPEMSVLRNSMFSLIFAGTLGDWNDIHTAKLDTRRVTVKYDKTRIIRSGNDSGVMKTYHHWHPMNKNLVYDDDESGGSKDQSTLSVTSKAGMGNYIVLDFFFCQEGGVETDLLKVASSTTLYWHEK